MPSFDNWKFEDAEMLVLLQQMFIDLELTTKYAIKASGFILFKSVQIISSNSSFTSSNDPGLSCLKKMLYKFCLQKKFYFILKMETLQNYLFEVYSNYNDVPYHNFRHAFVVTQMVIESF